VVSWMFATLSGGPSASLLVQKKLSSGEKYVVSSGLQEIYRGVLDVFFEWAS
jgi:hypothetical protein